MWQIPDPYWKVAVIVPFFIKISTHSPTNKKKKPGTRPGKIPEQKDPVPLSMGQSLRLFDQWY
ncbi:hypothetical protein EWS92_08875 [Vibrio vulnificus]|uniref:Uncharacterized protein n=1 Tax=Vibrio vulnificus TaxID=672 RepID=A0A2S3RDS5_VIBVL|nr:hypothetical protein BWZ32_13635 [Vibrio vulnificus]NVC63736.1 hypothetical protein [Vibrio sp. 05-20-BW147]EGQ8174879.1 hypothetical protein [Vibrio vulnificus]EGQ9238482.1 hypothetical protein [Vibrio vulnificus]EGQ9278350.1 hypothetical protein [Vibrio vulnificus]